MTHIRCPKCHGEILRGLDSTSCGIPITLDAAPVDNVGELLALTSGRRTFEARTTRDGRTVRRVFDERTPPVIRNHNPVLARPIHAEHRCHQPLPAATTASSDWNQEPPF